MDSNEFKDKLVSRKMTRRELNKALAAVGLTMAAFPIVSRHARAATDDNPVVFIWEGYEDPGLHPAYLKKHGESPNFTFFGDEEEAFAKMRAGFKPDITQPCSYKIPTWTDAGILSPIDTSRLSNWPDVVESLKTFPARSATVTGIGCARTGDRPRSSIARIWSTSRRNRGGCSGMSVTRAGFPCSTVSSTA